MFCLLLNFFFTRGNLIETKIPLKFTPLRSTFLLSTFWEKKRKSTVDTSIHQRRKPNKFKYPHTLKTLEAVQDICTKKLVDLLLSGMKSVSMDYNLSSPRLHNWIGCNTIVCHGAHTHSECHSWNGGVIQFVPGWEESRTLLVYTCANHPTQCTVHLPAFQQICVLSSCVTSKYLQSWCVDT